MISKKLIRDYLESEIKNIPALSNIPVFKKRRINLDDDTNQFVSLFFVQARVDVSGMEEETTTASIEIRINSCLPGDDDILDDLSDPIAESFGRNSCLNGLAEDFRLASWSYGDDEDSAFSYFSMIYNINVAENIES